MNKIYYGKIKGGKLILPERNILDNFIRSQRDCDVELILRKQKKTRSLQQNSYYWAVIIKLLSEHTGYSADEMHGVIKWKFVYTQDKSSTSDLSTFDYTVFIDEIREWAQQELDVYIPVPNEVELN